MIYNCIPNSRLTLEQTERFYEKHKAFIDDTRNEGWLNPGSLGLDKTSAAAAGDYFGREGWTRAVSYGNYGDFNWTRTIDEIEVIINNAESMELKGTPVPVSAFPIQLEDQKLPVSPGQSEGQDDEIPF